MDHMDDIDDVEPAPPPAGFIPPEFREPVHAELTEADIAAIQQTASIWEDGRRRPWTREEIIERIPGRVVGVRDTRTGQVTAMTSGTRIFEV